MFVGYYFCYKKMGVVVYWYVVNNYIVIFRYFILFGIWEVVYVIEGLFKVKLLVELDMVYLDI